MFRVAEAIFGLVGVIVGALITGGVEYFMRVRDEKAETRAAARLTHAELGHAEGLVAMALDSGKWELVREGSYPDDRWRQHEGLFGRLLGGDEWSAVAYGYTCTEVVGWTIAIAKTTPLGRRQLAPHSTVSAPREACSPPMRS
jgi:hypothetical protein